MFPASPQMTESFGYSGFWYLLILQSQMYKVKLYYDICELIRNKEETIRMGILLFKEKKNFFTLTAENATSG